MSQACMLSGKLVLISWLKSGVLSRLLPLVQKYLGTRTLEKDYPSETGYPLDNSRQTDNTS